MNTNLYITRLHGLANDQDVDPRKLARTFIKTLLQFGEVNKSGAEAIELVRNTFIRDHVSSLTGVRRVRARKQKLVDSDNTEKATEKSAVTRRSMSAAQKKQISEKMKKFHRNKRKERNTQTETVA